MQQLELGILDWIQANLRCGALDVLMPALSWTCNHGEIWIVLAAVFQPWNFHYEPGASLILAFLAIVLLGTVTAFSLYMHGVKLIGPARASLYACVEPIAATLLSAFWLHEPFALIDLLGFAMIIATILILGYSDLKAQ